MIQHSHHGHGEVWRELIKLIPGTVNIAIHLNDHRIMTSIIQCLIVALANQVSVYTAELTHTLFCP